MKYLKEVVESVSSVISEGANKEKQYFIEGCFMQGDIQNRNGRVYPMGILEAAVEKYKAMIKANRALGELNHPDHIQVNPKEASHLITDLWVEGNNIMGRAKILDTPNGKIVKALLDGGVQLGVSSRGFGSLKERNGVKEVQEDFTLATVDIVSDPSAPGAFVNPIMESKEFAMVNGMIMEVNEETERAILEKHGITLSEESLDEANKVHTNSHGDSLRIDKKAGKQTFAHYYSKDSAADKTVPIKDSEVSSRVKSHLSATKKKHWHSVNESEALVALEKFLNEISKELAGKYLHKAIHQNNGNTMDIYRGYAKGKPDDSTMARHKYNKRNAGIKKAINKLTKESFEDILDKMLSDKD